MRNITTIPDRSDIFALRSAAAVRAGQAQHAPVAYPMPTVTEVLKGYDFQTYEWRTFQTFDRRALSTSMTVTSKTDPTSHFVVMFDACTGEWTAQCPSRRHDHAPVIIDAARRVYAEMAN